MPEIKVIFCLSSSNDDIDFEMITEVLNIIPTGIRKKVEFSIQSINLGIASNEWVICSKKQYCRTVSLQID